MRIGKSIAAILAALAMTPSADALNPDVRISQYAHTAWRMQDGAFDAAPNAIAQTADGAIWIGTGAGLVRFDGIRFVPWTPPQGQSLPASAIYSLRAASDGTLWIGTGAGLASWNQGRLKTFVSGRINQIIEDREGAIWVGRSRVRDAKGGFCRVAQGEVSCFGNSPELNVPYAGPVAQDKQGNLWVGSSVQLLRWKSGSFTSYFREQLKSTAGLSSVEAIAASEDGSIWAAISSSGLGLQQIIGGVPKSVRLAGIGTAQINNLFFDANHSLWMGTFRDGIYRLRNGQVDHFSIEDGLSSSTVSGFFEDREGGLWVATSKGLDHFRDNRVVTFSVREGLATDLAASVLASRDGTVWIGNHDALDFVRKDRVASIRARDGFPGKRVTSLWEDRAGRLWVGIDNLLTVYEHGKFLKINLPDGSPLGTVVALGEDRDGNIWAEVIGAERRLFRIRDMRVQEQFDASQMPAVRVMAADPTGGIWLGLQNGNLAHYRGGKFDTVVLPTAGEAVSGLMADPDGSVWVSTTKGLVHGKNVLSSKNGLPCDQIDSAIRDDRGALWLYAKCGLIVIAQAELKRWLEQPDAVLQVRTFDVLDGGQPALSSFQPSVTKSTDGRLWFVNDAIVQMIDPGQLQENRIAPPVYVERVRADRRDYATGGNQRLPPRTRDIEIDFTAFSFTIPQKVRFRYKLDGRDLEWQDAGTRRQVFYSDLPPRQYRFHVTASNNDGVWNEAGTAIDFEVLPSYYQTLWFRLLCAFAAIGGLALIYRIRVRQIAAQMNTRFDERLAERTRLARDFHDTMLQTIQGSKMVADDALDQEMDPVRMRSVLERLSTWLGQAVQEGRSTLGALRSSTIDRNDLAEALGRAGEECRAQRSIEFKLSVAGSGREMHPIARDEVFRIGYEAIRNACTHSGASRVKVELSYEGNLVLRVRDNGAGMEAEVASEGKPGHFGLLGMRERASRLRGKLTLSSSPETGTEVELVVPRHIVFQSPDEVKRGWGKGLKRFF